MEIENYNQNKNDITQEQEPEPVILDNSKEIQDVKKEKFKIESKNNMWLVWCTAVILAISGIIAIIKAKKKVK